MWRNLLTFHVFCIYKKLFEKKSITSERLSIRHETQCNVKSGVFYCLTNMIIIIIYMYMYMYIYIYITEAHTDTEMFILHHIYWRSKYTKQYKVIINYLFTVLSTYNNRYVFHFIKYNFWNSSAVYKLFCCHFDSGTNS